MTLAEYMKANDLDDEAFAKLLRDAGRPVDRATVTKWRRGVHTPRPPFMRAIIDATGQEVGASDLLAKQREAA